MVGVGAAVVPSGGPPAVLASCWLVDDGIVKRNRKAERLNHTLMYIHPYLDQRGHGPEEAELRGHLRQDGWGVGGRGLGEHAMEEGEDAA